MAAMSRRADMFTRSRSDPRKVGATRLGDERETTLVEFPALPATDAGAEVRRSGRRPARPPRGRAVHCVSAGPGAAPADVERSWFRKVIARQGGQPSRYSSPENLDENLDGAVANDEVAAEAWRAGREKVALAEQLVPTPPTSDSSPTPAITARSRCARCWSTWSRSARGPTVSRSPARAHRQVGK